MNHLWFAYVDFIFEICCQTKYLLIMKLLKISIACIAAISVLACKTGTEPEPVPPGSIVLSEDEITVPAEGGAAGISYTFEDGLDESELEFMFDADWITDMHSNAPGSITFNVAVNSEYSQREVVVEVSCPARNTSDTFKVVQSAAEEVVEDTGLEINILEVTANSFTFNIVPEDKEMPYVYRFAEQSLFESYGSDDGCIAYCINYYQEAASYYEMSLSEYLPSVLTYGDRPDTTIIPVLPETTYTLFAFGLSPEGNPLTGLAKEKFTTEKAQNVDMTFDIDISVSGVNVTMSVTPSDDSQRYFFDMSFASDVGNGEDYGMLAEYVQKYINEIITNYRFYYGMTLEGVIQMMESYGQDSYSTTLEYGNSYAGFAAAISETGLVISEIACEIFETEAAPVSGNQIDVSVSNIGPNSVDYSVTTTTDDQYVFGYDTAGWWEGYSDDDILMALIYGYDLSNSLHNGDISGTISGLEPDTEYFIYTFGYEGGSATSDIIITRFRTKVSGSAPAGVNAGPDGKGRQSGFRFRL